MPQTETYTLSMGPQHPSTHGVLQVRLDLDGENILKYTKEIDAYRQKVGMVFQLFNLFENLSVLDNVGSGLLSALGGMGVAFYTSLTGAFCSILLTLLRTIFNPQSQRERLETRLEMWLDTEIAPTLETEAAKDDADLINKMVSALDGAVKDFRTNLELAATGYARATQLASNALAASSERNQQVLESFDASVGRFNDGVHDFSEVDYNLRGSVERMDLAVRDLAAAMREINRRMGGGKQ